MKNRSDDIVVVLSIYLMCVMILYRFRFWIIGFCCGGGADFLFAC